MPSASRLVQGSSSSTQGTSLKDGLGQFYPLFHSTAVIADLFLWLLFRGQRLSIASWILNARQEWFELGVESEELGSGHFFNEFEVRSCNGDMLVEVIGG